MSERASEKGGKGPSTYLSLAKDLLEVLGKAILGFLGVAYVVGLVVVNCYLNRFGVNSPTLLQISYISAGVWAILFVLGWLGVLLFVIYLLLSLSARFNTWMYSLVPITILDDPSDRPLTWTKVILFVTFSLGSVVFMVLACAPLEYPLRPVLVALVSGFVAALHLGVFMPVAAILPASRPAHFCLCSFAIVVGCLVLLAHVLVFAYDTYGSIPAALGGGEPKEVQLVLKKEARPEIRKALQEAGIRFRDDSQATESIKLLFATDQEYVFLLRRPGYAFESGITIRRDLVEAIIYQVWTPGGGSSSW